MAAFVLVLSLAAQVFGSPMRRVSTPPSALSLGLSSPPVHSTTPAPSLDVLPRHILNQILDPKNGLSGTDVKSLYSTSQDMKGLRSELLPERQFYYSFAEPHLSIRVGDPPVRVYQSLYRCGRLDADAKSDLIRLTNFESGQDVDFEDAELVVLCAKGLTALVASHVFPGVDPIPDRFKIQLVYQTMTMEGASDKLIKLFRFSSRTVRQTLRYARQCDGILRALHGEDNELDLESFFEANIMVASGCILWIREVKGASMNSARNREPARTLFRLEQENLDSLEAYKTMRKEFDASEMSVKSISDFVNRGLLLNLAVPFRDFGRSMSNLFMNQPSRHQVILENFLEAGYRIDHEREPFEDEYFSPIMTQGHDGALWLLENGADVDHQSIGRSTTLFSLMTLYRRHNDSRAPFLVDNGADVMLTGSSGLCPLVLLASEKDAQIALPLIKYFVEKGRPNLNRRILDGDPFIFTLLANRPEFSVFQYLVEKGMNVHVRNKAGETLLQVAERLSLVRIASWISYFPDPKKVVSAVSSGSREQETSPSSSSVAVEMARRAAVIVNGGSSLLGSPFVKGAAMVIPSRRSSSAVSTSASSSYSSIDSPSTSSYASQLSSMEAIPVARMFAKETEKGSRSDVSASNDDAAARPPPSHRTSSNLFRFFFDS